MDITRDAVLKNRDWTPIPFEIEEWGGTIYLRALNAQESIQLSKLSESQEDVPLDKMIGVLLQTVVDKDGKPLFQEGDISLLMQKSMLIIKRILDRISALNNITIEGVDEAKKP